MGLYYDTAPNEKICPKIPEAIYMFSPIVRG
jgi:hypothetical protein